MNELAEKKYCKCTEPKYNYPEMIWCVKCGKEIPKKMDRVREYCIEQEKLNVGIKSNGKVTYCLTLEQVKQFALSVRPTDEQIKNDKRELLIAFVKDWYKDNPIISFERQVIMVDKFLTST